MTDVDDVDDVDVDDIEEVEEVEEIEEVVFADTDVELDPAAELVSEPPGSANIVPKLGTKFDDPEQQFPSYAQHHVPPESVGSHAMTFTNEVLLARN